MNMRTSYYERRMTNKNVRIDYRKGKMTNENARDILQREGGSTGAQQFTASKTRHEFYFRLFCTRAHTKLLRKHGACLAVQFNTE